MISELLQPQSITKHKSKTIKCYVGQAGNIDEKTVSSFGEEWAAFHEFDDAELKKFGDIYFDVVKPEMMGKNYSAIDFGCGSGRWTRYISNKFGEIAAIDPSDAIFSAAELLNDIDNVHLYKTSIDNLPFADNYFDFGFSLGVLHHIPDTGKAMVDCVKKIKPGGHFLVYLYYALDNRSVLFKALFQASNLLRRGISSMPPKTKKVTCDVLAVLFYMPFVTLCRGLRVVGVSEKLRQKIPLQFYEKSSFYIIRNDSLDRFGTPLEQRFTKAQIAEMMTRAGLTDIVFSESTPYWHAVGTKA